MRHAPFMSMKRALGRGNANEGSMAGAVGRRSHAESCIGSSGASEPAPCLHECEEKISMRVERIAGAAGLYPRRRAGKSVPERAEV